LWIEISFFKLGLIILPKAFVRSRHYGILSSYHKRTSLSELQEILVKVHLPERATLQHRVCPVCKKGQLETIVLFKIRGPPEGWENKLQKQK